MKNLINHLKPHWKWVIIALVAHFIQAFTTLLLPTYTSNLVDVGIQNRGVELAVPLKMTANSMSEFEMLLLPEEQELIEEHYTQDGNGNYTIKSSVEENEELMTALSESFEVPLAMYQTISGMSEEELAATAQESDSSEVMDLSGMRDEYVEKMNTLGPAMVHSTAIQSVLETTEEAGGDLSSTQINYVLTQGGQMLLIALVAFGGGALAAYVAAVVGAKVGSTLRTKSYEKVLQFSNEEMEKFSTASLITRGTNDVQQVQMVVTVFFRIVLFSPMLAIGALFYVFQSQISMSWITILALSLVGVLMGILMSVVIPRFKVLQKQIDKVNLFAREILTGLQVIRAFGRQDLESERFDGANQDLRNSYIFVGRTMALMNPILLLIANGISVLIIWVGSHRIGDGLMQVGEMMAFITYTMQVIFSFFMLTMMSIMIPRAIVSGERIQEILDTPLSINDKEDVKVIESPKGVVEFDNVSYKFTGADNNVINNISFTAEPGKTTAIIGGTGSGKSTILNLLMRFYDVSEGSIKIDGVDIRDISQEQLRDIIGYVPQKAVLFSGTIESNIGYGVDSLSDEVMHESADIAHATEFIEEKKRGFKERISQGGGNVSGGQKQRLSIARAIAKQPKVFIFDDSFSALDYKTDASLRQALSEKVSDASMIIVAQRISTILDAEQILVLDEGKVAGLGNHLELMETSEVYREIATSQLSQVELDNYEEQFKQEREGE
ncbi:ABC transporter ATP-binding protein [Ruoffia tabacinasalis]|uniref:ABC transporter ATP-binding protein n=1 Tax=Ruoffia tabacinasalis TaxID=87458 RepID=A0A5R9EGG5_9LACT|nr:ABC transporter ATP-binding protein [Ruoffia tabacinasalis]TLQ49254.1 ABC transporter ATP-binding protein [Ruoffia tabacinasalis]